MHRSVGVLLVVALLGACTDDRAAPATTAPTAARDDVGVTLQQYRSDEVEHIMGVQVTNRSEGTIEVHSVQLDWPGLQPVDPRIVDYPLSPGVVVDLPIDYGDAVCDDPPAFVEPTPDAPVRVQVVTADGLHETWPVDDVRGVLARVHGLDCRRQAMEYRVDVTIGRSWTPSTSGDAVTGDLVLTRDHATGPVDLTGISGSVLLNVDVAAGTPTTMDGDRLSVPIVITSTGNCTGHALADSKKTFDFQVTVQVDGEEASISVGPDPADQQTVYRPVEVTCGL